MKITRFLVLALLILATIITCVACGGNDEPEKTSGSKATKPTTNKVEEVIEDPCPNGGSHEWEVIADQIMMEATCKNTGWGGFECKKCGDTKEDQIDLLDHNLGEVQITEATCQVEGQKFQTCAECGENVVLETYERGDHKWSKKNDGTFEELSCPDCKVTFVKHLNEADLVAMHFDDSAIDYVELTNGFSFDETGFADAQKVLSTDPVTGKETKGGNRVIALDPARANSMMRIFDGNHVLADKDSYVIQFDVMVQTLPSEMNSFLTVVSKDAAGDETYSALLYLTKDGYFGITDETNYGSGAKLDKKITLNKWVNVAVVVGEKYNDGKGDTWSDRVKYEVYIDGEKVTKLVGGKAAAGAAGSYNVENLKKECVIRIGDGGFSSTAQGENVNNGEFLLDNILIYSGNTVKKPLMQSTTYKVEMPILKSVLED